MGATTELDRRLLRALRARPSHGYALAQALAGDGGPDRATVYRRLAALQRRGLVAATQGPGAGAARRTLRLSPAGEAALRDELGQALFRLMEGFHDHARAQRSAGSPPRWKPALVFVSGSRLSGVEAGILRTLAAAMPRQTTAVLPPGVALQGPAPPGLAVLEGTFAALPLRDGYARTLVVNEVPPEPALARAAREWARVLAKGGALSVVAPAPLPRGVDPFVDYLALLQEGLFPDTAARPTTDRVTAALRARFGAVRLHREGDQLVWQARR